MVLPEVFEALLVFAALPAVEADLEPVFVLVPVPHPLSEVAIKPKVNKIASDFFIFSLFPPIYGCCIIVAYILTGTPCFSLVIQLSPVLLLLQVLILYLLQV